MNKETISRIAAKLRKRVLGEVKDRNPNAEDARKYLHTKYAIMSLGYTYQERPDLDMELRLVGEKNTVKRSVIVGQLDKSRKLIAVSERMSPQESLFTSAHELGHLMLDHPMPKAHRDRPIVLRASRPPMEREADEFAAAYLMPKKWIIGDFQARFGHAPIKVDETLAWWLNPNDFQSTCTARHENNLYWEVKVSICKNLGSGIFVSMCDLYGVTPTAMALRLKELELVDASRLSCW